MSLGFQIWNLAFQFVLLVAVRPAMPGFIFFLKTVEPYDRCILLGLTFNFSALSIRHVQGLFTWCNCNYNYNSQLNGCMESSVSVHMVQLGQRDGIHGGYRNSSPHTISQILSLWGGGGYSGVRNENTQSAKICLNFNFQWGRGSLV